MVKKGSKVWPKGQIKPRIYIGPFEILGRIGQSLQSALLRELSNIHNVSMLPESHHYLFPASVDPRGSILGNGNSPDRPRKEKTLRQLLHRNQHLKVATERLEDEMHRQYLYLF